MLFQFLIALIHYTAVQAMLVGALIWLMQSLIAERVKNAVKADYDQKLEKLKAELKFSSDKEIEELKSRLGI